MKIHSGTLRSRPIGCSISLIFICALLAPAQSEARTRSICELFPRPCGRDNEITCDSSPSCDAGFASFAFDSFDPIRCAPIPFTFFDFLSDFCYDCCEAGKLAGASGCNSGLTHSRPQNLVGGTIAPCSHLLPADAATTNFQIDILGLPIATYSFNPPSSVDLVNARGVCSRGNPVRFSGASREVWPASSSLSSERSTIFVIHGRGGSCAGFDELLTDAIYDRNQLTYCVEYDAQTVVGEDPPRSTPGPAGRAVKIIPVLQDQTGEGPSTCPGTPSSCSFDRSNPAVVVQALTLSVEGVAEALARAIALVPTEGKITLIPSSQGGFIARALLHRHYDDLRWQGKEISRVVSLAHPYFGVLTDPSLVTGWACNGDSFSFKDCRVSRWLWGWQNWLATSPADAIDNLDFPQIQWSAIAGDSSTGNVAGVLTEALGTDECIATFGGVLPSSVAGDGTVTILSSLGVDEHDFFPIGELSFDESIEASGCDHKANCLLRGAVSVLGDDLLARTSSSRNAQTLVFGGAAQVAVTDPAALAALSVSDAITLEVWVRPRSMDQMVILSKGEEYRLELFQGGVRWSLGGFGGNDIYGTDVQVAPVDQWTHIAVTYDASDGDVRTYANGVLRHTEPGSGGLLMDGDPTHNELRIGGHEDESFLLAPMYGALDELRIWRRALTPAEIAAGMKGNPGAGDQTELVAWWRFDEADGEVLLDSSASGLNASLANFPQRPWRFGAPREVPNGALYFDGVDDRSVVDDPAALLDEFQFRFNKRWREADLFLPVSHAAIAANPFPCQSLTAEPTG